MSRSVQRYAFYLAIIVKVHFILILMSCRLTKHFLQTWKLAHTSMIHSQLGVGYSKQLHSVNISYICLESYCITNLNYCIMFREIAYKASNIQIRFFCVNEKTLSPWFGELSLLFYPSCPVSSLVPENTSLMVHLPLYFILHLHNICNRSKAYTHTQT